MGYINDFRDKLSRLIDEGKREEALKLAASICLESYRNGMKAASVEEQDKQKANRYAKRVKGK